MILEGCVDFGIVADKLSQQAVHFVEACLQKDPSKRPQMKELVEHPWLCLPDELPDVHEMEEHHKNLKIFT